MPCRAAASVLAISALATALPGCARRETVPDVREPPSHGETLAQSPEPEPRDEVMIGDATWYGAQLAGHRTASGERFDPRQMTAAHRSLPFGTWVEVTCLDTGRRARVRITDRGPFGHEERIIDVSRTAAEKLGFVHRGVARVEVRIVGGPLAP